MNWSIRQPLPFTHMPEHAISTALDGNVQYVMWLDSPTGDYLEIRSAKKNLTNNKWNSARSLGIKNALFPSLAIANGVKLVAWESALPIGGIHRVGMLSFTRLSIMGIPVPLGNGRWIPTPSDGIGDYHPSVGISADGLQHIIYSHGGQLQHAMWNGRKFVIGKVSDTGGESYFPACAVDVSNPMTLHLGWENVVTHKVYYSQKQAQIKSWTPELELGEGSQVNVCALKGVVVAVWSGTDVHQIMCRVWNGSWSALEIPFALKQSYHPHCSIATDGTVSVCWMQYVSPNYQIYFAQRIKGVWTKATPLPQQGSFADMNDIVCDSAGKLHVVYLAKENATKQAFSTDSI